MGTDGYLPQYKFTVSEVVDAFRCPMYFFLKRSGAKGSFVYKSDGIGTLFHSILNKIVNEIKSPTLFKIDIADKPLIELDKIITEELYRLFLEEVKRKDYTRNLDTAWKEIETMGLFFSKKFTRKSEQEVNDMLIFTERHIEFIMNNACIKGKIDLLLKEGMTISLIDYKTKEEDISTDVIQISLYKYGIEEMLGERVIPKIFYVSNGVLEEKRFTEKEYQKMLPIIKNKILDMENYIEGRAKPYRSKNTGICNFCTLKRICSV